MTDGKFVSYLRVSTDKQGRSGLGLEAQKEAVTRYLSANGGALIGEFIEVETGKNDARPRLAEALRVARANRATLVIAKLDRLSRSVGFIDNLIETKVKFVCADMPEANELTIGLLALMAKHERKAISERTRAAMQAAKARGRQFGQRVGQAPGLIGLGNGAAVQAIKAGADAYARDMLPTIADIQAGGADSLRRIAAELNARGIPTARGGRWHPATVANVLQRAAPAAS